MLLLSQEEEGGSETGGLSIPKIVILGSLTLGEYEVLFPQKFNPELYEKDHEAAYEKAKEVFYPAMDDADVILALVPDTLHIGKHTKQDIGYSMEKGKAVIIITQKEIDEAIHRAEVANRIKVPRSQKYTWLF